VDTIRDGAARAQATRIESGHQRHDDGLHAAIENRPTSKGDFAPKRTSRWQSGLRKSRVYRCAMKKVDDVRGLSNRMLLSRIHESARASKRRLVQEIVMLMEVERRRLHLGLAYSSMYEFCYREMGLSEDQAYRYMNAARMARTFPDILMDLESGRLHLASLALLKKHAKRQDDRWVLDMARGKSKREVERALAKQFPKDDDPFTRITPLSEARSKLEMHVTNCAIEKLEYAIQLMSHSNPNHDAAFVFEAALDELIPKLEKTRQAKADNPKPKPKPPETETKTTTTTQEADEISLLTKEADEISRGVRREVFERDGWRCTFVSESTGKRCESQSFLELDHALPRALNGKSDPQNVRVLCRAHNNYEARRLLGNRCVDRAINDSRNPARAGASLPRDLQSIEIQTSH
jgi:hypothetical protein